MKTKLQKELEREREGMKNIMWRGEKDIDRLNLVLQTLPRERRERFMKLIWEVVEIYVATGKWSEIRVPKDPNRVPVPYIHG